jgi:hypothetical protein
LDPLRVVNAIVSVGLAASAACMGAGLFLFRSQSFAGALLGGGAMLGLLTALAAWTLFVAMVVLSVVRSARSGRMYRPRSFAFIAANAFVAMAGTLIVLYAGA